MSSPAPPRQPVGWFRRTMCLLTLHFRAELPHLTPVDPARPCRRQPRCDCGRALLPAQTVHDYGAPEAGDRLCERVKVCGRCGYRKWWLEHTVADSYSIPLRDVPEHRREGYEVYDCQYVFLCVICGDIAHLDERHDWHEDLVGPKVPLLRPHLPRRRLITAACRPLRRDGETFTWTSKALRARRSALDVQVSETGGVPPRCRQVMVRIRYGRRGCVPVQRGGCGDGNR